MLKFWSELSMLCGWSYGWIYPSILKLVFIFVCLYLWPNLSLDFEVNCQFYIVGFVARFVFGFIYFKVWQINYCHLSCIILKFYVGCGFVWHFVCVRFVKGQPLPSISMSNVPKSPIPRKKDMQVENRLVIVTSYTFMLVDLYTFQIETNIFSWKHVQMKAHYWGASLGTLTCA
jgi:hypothetical protein